MSASLRALFACGSGRKSLVLLGLVRSFVAKQQLKKVPNTDACIPREFTSGTGLPAAKNATLSGRFLNKNLFTDSVSKSVPSLPSIICSKPNAPSFGASALVVQTKINVENGVYRGVFSKNSIPKEKMSEDVGKNFEAENKMKNNLFGHDGLKRESFTNNALYKYAVLDKNVQRIEPKSNVGLVGERKNTFERFAAARATPTPSRCENNRMDALEDFARLGFSKQPHNSEVKVKSVSIDPLLSYALL